MQLTSGTSTALPSELVEELRDVVDEVVREVDAAEHVTLAFVGFGKPWVVVSTDETAEALNEVEQTSGGPALDALWSGRITRITSMHSHAYWPEYLAACTQHKVGCVVAFPISIGGAHVGVMTVASRDYFALGPEETRIGVRATDRATGILNSK
jgi:transcriptional regulator with GAF, ATPase, and Fis domain